MNSSSGCSRWIAIWGSKNGSGSHTGAMAGLNSRHMETAPDYLDTLPQLPQVILKNEASSRFRRGEAFSRLEILRGCSGQSGRSLTILRMIAWMETLSGNCCNAPSKTL